MRSTYSYFVIAAVGLSALPLVARAQQPGNEANAAYSAHVATLNQNATGVQAAAEARFSIDGDRLTIDIDAHDLAPNMMHLQHFHGFQDGSPSSCPTRAADKNGDGIIDLIETEPMAGITMVPFHEDPVSMAIVNDTYPKASANGS